MVGEEETLYNEIKKLHPLERKVLQAVNGKEEIKLTEIIENSNLKEAEVMRAINWLKEKGYLNFNKVEIRKIVLGENGKKYLKEGLPEIKLLKEVINYKEVNINKLIKELNLEKEEVNIAIGVLKKKGLIYITKEKNVLILSKTELSEKYLKDYINPLIAFKKLRNVNELSKNEVLILKEFSKRKKILKEVVEKDFLIKLTDKGKEIINFIKRKNIELDFIENITEEVIKKELWKKKEFRAYDINSKVPLPEIGRRHPILESNKILGEIFVEMGFKEMEGPIVESAFWNMDVMWIPQDHPARDEQDTFYLEGKAKLPKEYLNKVKEMHEKGLKRTHTTQGDWKEEISSRRLLRTHSTATTFRTLAKLGEKLKKGGEINGKYFYIANNFRNEAVDATHLAEFFQAEGFIIGDNLSLADLMGFVKEYYAKLGLTKIRFKPTFNPYTEPSMEAHYYDEKMNKWYALINSGIFREETLKPFGLEKKRIIAWGMGASRVAALLSRKQSMREITGATVDIEWIKDRPIMRREIIRK